MSELNKNDQHESQVPSNEPGTPKHEFIGKANNNKEEKMNLENAEALNLKIIKITQIIKAKFPELSKFLDEMPVTIPNKNQPEISYKDLSEYYQSLEAILKKYKLENRDR